MGFQAEDIGDVGSEGREPRFRYEIQIHIVVKCKKKGSRGPTNQTEKGFLEAVGSTFGVVWTLVHGPVA